MKPSVLVCRRIFPDVLDRLRAHFDVEDNQADAIWSTDELIARLQGKAGVWITGTQPIDAACSTPARSCVLSAAWPWATTTSMSRPAPHAA